MKIIMPHSLSVGMGVVGPAGLPVKVAMASAALLPRSVTKPPGSSVLI